MVKDAFDMIDNGKKSLETLLREKAYEQVKERLLREGIEIDSVSEEDIEALVQARVDDMNSTLKGVAYGSALTFIVSSIVGF